MLPAYAGMILDSITLRSNASCAPRIRGDDPMAIVDMSDNAKCSPHTRG